MIDYISPYIVGESLYSYVARLHWYSTTRNWQMTNHAIFSVDEVRLHPSSPAHIANVARFTVTDKGLLLTMATSYPLLVIGLLDVHSKVELMHAMLSENGSNIAASSRQSSSRLAFGNYFYFCEKCISQDEFLHGSSLWHLNHQLNGVTVCPVHEINLSKIPAGSGGVNHHYELPCREWIVHQEPANQAAIKLSLFITRLHSYLCSVSFIGNLSDLYTHYLKAAGYLTQSGNIRRNELQQGLQNHWHGLFKPSEPVLPMILADFKYVPKLLHRMTNVHYIKHVLLMGFFAETPELFFNGVKSCIINKLDHEKTIEPSKVSLEAQVLSLLRNKVAMRQISSQVGYSIGRIKTIALTHGIEVEHRRKYITEEMERSVWRKAILGQHKSDIANQIGISIGAAEKIIQCHSGLPQWRRDLTMIKRKVGSRKHLLSVMNQGHELLRSEIKKHCQKDYTWLLTYDRAWLEANLPSPHKNRNIAHMNWSLRDDVVLEQLMHQQEDFHSMSAIDRVIGGHCWLLKYQHKLPKSTAYALKMLKFSEDKSE
jgi:hypothetical protein